MQRNLSTSARRVDWLVLVACAIAGLAIAVASAVIVLFLTSTCSESFDCDEGARSIGISMGALASLAAMPVMVLATVMLHRRRLQAWWSSMIVLGLTLLASLFGIGVGIDSVG